MKYGEVIYGGCTISSGDYLDIVNTRTAQVSVSQVKTYTDAMLGSGSTKDQLNKAVDAALSNLKTNNILRGYSYAVSMDQINGIAYVKMELTPYFNVRSIGVTAQIDLRRLV